MKLLAEAEQAMADLRAIRELHLSEPEVFVLLSRLINEGTSILQIDRRMTDFAGNEVVLYKLADELQAILAAVRARNIHAGKIEGAAMGGHDGAPLSTRQGAPSCREKFQNLKRSGPQKKP